MVSWERTPCSSRHGPGNLKFGGRIGAVDLEKEVREAAEEAFEGSDMPYHNFQHSREFVQRVKEVCDEAGVEARERENLVLAAGFTTWAPLPVTNATSREA